MFMQTERMIKKDLVIVGGGPAGLAAAVKAREKGVKDILIVERGGRLGGILNQCIHDGFGLELFKKAYTGPEFAQNFIDKIQQMKVECLLNSAVLDLKPDKTLTIVSPKGLLEIKAKAVILTTGCRERTREMLKIPGSRPAGVYTAGCAQNLINLLGYMPGRKVVILGSGDVGLIMARRLTLEGAEVLAVVEILPYSSGLRRNMVQCLQDYEIPLYLSHTVVEIKGRKRVESIVIAKVDDRLQPVKNTEKEFQCDTLLLSVGLIPENELAEKTGVEIDPLTSGPAVNEFNETSIQGIYSAGNSLQVHDLVDWACLEAENAGMHAADFLLSGIQGKRNLKTKAGSGIRQVVPQYYSGEREITLSLRVATPARDRNIVVKDGERIVKKVFCRELNPAEMIRVALTKEEVKDSEELVVTVSE
jgi:thioredoxin reductase